MRALIPLLLLARRIDIAKPTLTKLTAETIPAARRSLCACSGARRRRHRP